MRLREVAFRVDAVNILAEIAHLSLIKINSSDIYNFHTSGHLGGRFQTAKQIKLILIANCLKTSLRGQSIGFFDPLQGLRAESPNLIAKNGSLLGFIGN